MLPRQEMGQATQETALPVVPGPPARDRRSYRAKSSYPAVSKPLSATSGDGRERRIFRRRIRGELVFLGQDSDRECQPRGEPANDRQR